MHLTCNIKKSTDLPTCILFYFYPLRRALVSAKLVFKAPSVTTTVQRASLEPVVSTDVTVKRAKGVNQ